MTRRSISGVTRSPCHCRDRWRAPDVPRCAQRQICRAGRARSGNLSTLGHRPKGRDVDVRPAGTVLRVAAACVVLLLLGDGCTFGEREPDWKNKPAAASRVMDALTNEYIA